MEVEFAKIVSIILKESTAIVVNPGTIDHMAELWIQSMSVNVCDFPLRNVSK